MIVGFQTNFCEDIDKYIEHKAPVIENIYSMMRGFCEVWKQPYRQQIRFVSPAIVSFHNRQNLIFMSFLTRHPAGFVVYKVFALLHTASE